MAQYDIRLREISAEMLDELADFAHRAWGRTDVLEVEVIPGQSVEVRQPALMTGEEVAMDAMRKMGMAVPDPIPATPTGTVEIVLPPEPVEDYAEDPAPKSPRGRK